MKKIFTILAALVLFSTAYASVDSEKKLQTDLKEFDNFQISVTICPTNEKMEIFKSACETTTTNFLIAGRGCCSWHGGQCGCVGGRVKCCDGTLSPSCRC